MEKYTKLADNSSIEKTIKALKENNIEVFISNNSDETRKQVLKLIPERSEVMTMTSATLDATGLSTEINESGKFDSVRKKLNSMDRKTQGREMNHLGASPKFAIGSVHAVTEDGHILIASATGSQLPAYVYSAENVIFVVGINKIVKNTDEGIKRIYKHSFPLENERAMKAYGMNSMVGKILILNKEFKPGRINLIFVKEKLGF